MENNANENSIIYTWGFVYVCVCVLINVFSTPVEQRETLN